MGYGKRLLAGALAALLLGGCGTSGSDGSSASSGEEGQSPVSEVQEAPVVPETRQAVLLAAGDNLIHDVIYWQAAARTGGEGYDFGPAYERIAPLLEGADFAFINQETVLAGAELPPSSYPMFCSPTEVGEEMLKLGFNLFSTANNHCFDKGEAGLQASGRFWDSHPEAAVAGCYRTPEERDRTVLLTKEGITVALVAAAEQTNGLSLPAESQAGVLLLSDRETLLRKLEEASAQADFVILSVHWGVEGAAAPSESQKALAQELAEAGADLILGHHSHVLQGGEFLETSRGRSYVAYSLGNFISAQVGAQNMAGGFLRVELTMEEGEAAGIEKVEFIPTVTHYGPSFRDLMVYPFSEYTPELAESHGVRAHDSRFGWQYLEDQLAALDFGV